MYLFVYGQSHQCHKAPFIDVNDTELYDDYKFVLEVTNMLHKLHRAVAVNNANNNDVDTSDDEEEIGQEVVDNLSIDDSVVLHLERANLDDYNDDEFSAYKLNQEMVEKNNDSDADSIDEPWGEGDSAGDSRDGGVMVYLAHLKSSWQHFLTIMIAQSLSACGRKMLQHFSLQSMVSLYQRA